MIKHIGLFGDSYISSSSYWVQQLEMLMPDRIFDMTGKGGANLYYAIREYQLKQEQKGRDFYQAVIFALTWPYRLFSCHPYRHEQFCAFSEFRVFEPDEVIKTQNGQPGIPVGHTALLSLHTRLRLEII